MKRSFVLVMMLASSMALSAAAQTSAGSSAAAPAGPAKIAVISFQVAVGQTNEGQRDFADLEKKYEPKQAALKSLNDEVDTLTKQLQGQGAALTDADRAAKAKSLDEKKKQLDRDTEDARNDFQQDMQDIYQSLASKVYDVMQSYAQQKGFTLVLDVSQQQTPVLWANEGTNITKAVIDAYNVKSGIPAPPAGQQAAPGAQSAPRSTRPATAAPKPATH